MTEIYHITLNLENQLAFNPPPLCCAILHNGTQRLPLPSTFDHLDFFQKIVIQGKKYSWYAHHIAKIARQSPYPPLAIPASKAIAPPLVNTQTVHSSRSRRRGDLSPNVPTVVNFEKPNKSTSNANAAMRGLQRVTPLQVYPSTSPLIHTPINIPAVPRKLQDPAFPHGVPANLTAIVTQSSEHGSDSEHAGS